MALTKLVAFAIILVAFDLSVIARGKGKGKSERSSARASAPWSYEDQSNWAGECKTGMRQSPIDIRTEEVEEMYEGPLHWSNNLTRLGMVTVKNSGHGFSVSGDEFDKLHLSGGGLKGKYKLAQFHYHWGSRLNGDRGSEHRVDNMQYASELHLVHYHADFDDIGKALESKNIDALAVVGVLLDKGDRRECNQYEEIMKKPDKMAAVILAGGSATTDLKATTIHDLLPEDTTHFYRYKGSLTTPGCNEQVVWSVLETRATICDDLLEQFVLIMDKEGTPLTYTARDVQKVHGRTVYHNGGHHQVADSGSSLAPFALGIAALLALASAFVN